MIIVKNNCTRVLNVSVQEVAAKVCPFTITIPVFSYLFMLNLFYKQRTSNLIVSVLCTTISKLLRDAYNNKTTKLSGPCC